MSTNFRIATLNNKSVAFYPLLGQFLANRKVINALDGYPPYDDDNREWFVALDEGNKVVGFSAVADMKSYVLLASNYVLPDYRHNGIFTHITHLEIEKYRHKQIRVVANQHSSKLYLAIGFIPYKPATKNYHYLYLQGLKKEEAE
ncbi:MAG: GNAT family N-acetyltransferase [Chloroflexi bacterium]|uniref:GNAT family N-acetyltransferase n=1 Tax=Candidatus Chlorohelix allophototropha TaxID=3003348 RepID=A0A8T7M0U6_9CHLR|nr:GNAT family N-acetyltransferase [Chloroflexota bacterium]WJW65810.1 GNAT family N-acetyltransferase [Chloroflexota bacterium L227-S17]